MFDDKADEISADDVLEAERPGKLNASVGNTPLPEDNSSPAGDQAAGPDDPSEEDTL